MIRKCSRCGQEKDYSEFGPANWGIGLDCWCKDCRKEYNNNYRRGLLPRNQGHRIEWTPEMVAEMMYKHQQGRSFLSIGRDLKVSYTSVRNFLIRYEQKIKELDDKNIAKNFHKS